MKKNDCKINNNTTDETEKRGVEVSLKGTAGEQDKETWNEKGAATDVQSDTVMPRTSRRIMGCQVGEIRFPSGRIQLTKHSRSRAKPATPTATTTSTTSGSFAVEIFFFVWPSNNSRRSRNRSFLPHGDKERMWRV